MIGMILGKSLRRPVTGVISEAYPDLCVWLLITVGRFPGVLIKLEGHLFAQVAVFLSEMDFSLFWEQSVRLLADLPIQSVEL